MSAYAPLARDDWRYDARTGAYNIVQLAPRHPRWLRALIVIGSSGIAWVSVVIVALMVIGAVR